MAWLKTTIVCGIIVALILLGVLVVVRPSRLETTAVSNNDSRSALLNNQAINLLIADTPPEQYQGLSDRERICESCGMLFSFATSEPRTFVMRRMKFPLDIVWVHDKTVVRVDTNLAPEQAEPFTPYSSGMAVDTVLELPAGAAERYGLTENSEFNLK